MKSLLVWPALAVVALLGGGCASYVTPGGGADLRSVGMTEAQRDALSDQSVAAAMATKPLAAFPCAIAVARIEEAGYHSQTAESFGYGRFGVVTTRDVEDDASMDRLNKLPQVRGIAPLNRLLFSSLNMYSDLPLRQAAGELHADLLLIYTLDTRFYVSDMSEPLTVFTLGLAPDQRTRVVCTASAVLMDTRTGYIYGIDEDTDTENGLAAAWTSDGAVDAMRLQTEKAAFKKLVGSFEKTWAGVVREHAAQ